MSLRSLTYFNRQKKDYLAIMYYDNFVILLDLSTNRYVKLIGHRSFIADVVYDQKEQMLVSGGLDHRISLARIEDIKENRWSRATQNGNIIEI